MGNNWGTGKPKICQLAAERIDNTWETKQETNEEDQILAIQTKIRQGLSVDHQSVVLLDDCRKKGEVFLLGPKNIEWQPTILLIITVLSIGFVGICRQSLAKPPFFSWCLLEHLVVDVLPGPSVDDGHEGSKENLKRFIDWYCVAFTARFASKTTPATRSPFLQKLSFQPCEAWQRRRWQTPNDEERRTENWPILR